MALQARLRQQRAICLPVAGDAQHGLEGTGLRETGILSAASFELLGADQELTPSNLLLLAEGGADRGGDRRSAHRHLRELSQAAHGDRGDRIVRVLGEDFRQHAAGVLQRGIVALQPRLYRRNVFAVARHRQHL